MLLQRHNGFSRFWMRFLEMLGVMIFSTRCRGMVSKVEIRRSKCGVDGQQATSDDLVVEHRQRQVE